MTISAKYRQVLTGGGATALDAIDGAGLNDGDPAFVLTGSNLYFYRLNASSGAAESSPDVISPDTNAGSKRWILQTIYNASAAGFGGYSNLKVENNATNPNYQMDITADRLTLDDGTSPKQLTSVSLTVDMTVSGKNGRGTSVSESSSTWYYVFVGDDDGTPYAWLDTSSTGANDPDATSAFKKRVGAIYNNSSSNLIPIAQIGNIATRLDAYNTDTVLSGGSSGTFVALSPKVPATSRTAIVFVQNTAGGTASNNTFSNDSSTALLYTTSASGNGVYFMPLNSSQQFQYKVTGGTSTLDVYGKGWVDRL